MHTCYVWCKNSKNQQLLDILAYNSTNKPSFRYLICWIIDQNVQKLLIRAVFASYITSILKGRVPNPLFDCLWEQGDKGAEWYQGHKGYTVIQL